MVMNYTLNKAVCVRHMAAEFEYDVSVFCILAQKSDSKVFCSSNR